MRRCQNPTPQRSSQDPLCWAAASGNWRHVGKVRKPNRGVDEKLTEFIAPMDVFIFMLGGFLCC